jgi:group I intron endonuclease
MIHKGLYESHNMSKLKRSLKKYGFENHIFEIIEKCAVEQLDDKEIYWIKMYNSIEKGLNILEGGQGVKMTEDIKDKISKKKKNHDCYKNKQRSEKISKALKGRKHNWGKGKEKTGKKQQNKFKEHLIKIHSKPIIQHDMNGTFLKEYSSIKEASIITSIHRENISCVLRGKTKTAGGYIWKYKLI